MSYLVPLNFRAFDLIVIKAKLFVSSLTMNDFFISVLLRASYEIESNIVNCRMCLVAKKSKKSKEKIKTQNKKILETDMNKWL